MTSELLVKIVLLGVCVCIINLILKQYQRAFILPVNILYIVTIALLTIGNLADKIENLTDLFTVSSSFGRALTSIYKSAAICILTKIASDLCEESGNIVVSDIIELGGRIALLVVAFPFVESIIKTATAFVS